MTNFNKNIPVVILASQASLRNQLMEAIYADDSYLLSNALSKAESSKGKLHIIIIPDIGEGKVSIYVVSNVDMISLANNVLRFL